MRREKPHEEDSQPCKPNEEATTQQKEPNKELHEMTGRYSAS
jgi:hypothetical protein